MDHNLSLSFSKEISPNEKMILGSEKKRNIFLVIKEGLHNIVKHANADSIRLKIITIKDKLKVELIDNGDGFDPTTINQKGFGLSSMEDRSKIIEGTLKIVSTPGTGVSLILEIPL